MPLSSKPERYQQLQEVCLEGGTPGCPARLEVESAWFHDRTLVFKFRGVDSISDAETLSGAEVRIPASERAPLEAGEFYLSDLVGCQVVDRASGENLGRVTGCEEAGGGVLLAIDNVWEIPFARAICVEISPADGRILVELPEGLKDLNRT